MPKPRKRRPRKRPRPCPEEGVGTELKKMLGWFKIGETEGCQCRVRACRMNRNGPDWCERHTMLIVRWMGEEAKRRELPFSRFAARRLVRWAIRRHRKTLPRKRTSL